MLVSGSVDGFLLLEKTDVHFSSATFLFTGRLPVFFEKRSVFGIRRSTEAHGVQCKTGLWKEPCGRLESQKVGGDNPGFWNDKSCSFFWGVLAKHHHV